MPANVETMFSVREKPWHGLGQIIDEAPTSRDAIEYAGLNWYVESNPIFDAKGNEIKGFKANTRSSDNSVLGVVTDKYKIVQNVEAFDFTDNIIGDEMRYETAGSLRNGKTIWLLGKMPDRYICEDKFEPYIVFTNSHDGTGAIKIAMTPIRVVCNNTLNMALQNAKRSWSTKHMGNMSAKLSEARHTLELANEYLNVLTVEADKMANETMTEDTIFKTLDEMFPISEDSSDRQKQNVQNAKDGIMICMLRPDIAKFANTKWGFINAVSDYVGHSIPARLTANYKENNWGKIMNGHPILDKAMNLVAV